MKKYLSSLVALFLLSIFPSFSLACGDEHFGFLVAMDKEAETFTIYHLGDHPEMGGHLFSFSAEPSVMEGLEIGTKVAVQFSADDDRLIAEEITEFST
jgi:hypothetical protein